MRAPAYAGLTAPKNKTAPRGTPFCCLPQCFLRLAAAPATGLALATGLPATFATGTRTVAAAGRDAAETRTARTCPPERAWGSIRTTLWPLGIASPDSWFHARSCATDTP